LRISHRTIPIVVHVIDAAMATANVAPEGFMFDPQAERMAREDLAALQLARLRATLDLAYSKVAHVRAKFDAAGVQPGQLKSLADIVRFPFSTKADLRDNYPFGLFAVPREQLVRIHASSGTTGKATIVGYTADDLELWTNLMARSIACAGARPGDVLHNAYGYGLFTGGLGFHYGAERLGCTVVPVSGGMTEPPARSAHIAARWLLPEPLGPTTAAMRSGQTGHESTSASADSFDGSARKSSRRKLSACGRSSASWRAPNSRMTQRRPDLSRGVEPV
jgi:hypothetical protein